MAKKIKTSKAAKKPIAKKPLKKSPSASRPGKPMKKSVKPAKKVVTKSAHRPTAKSKAGSTASKIKKTMARVVKPVAKALKKVTPGEKKALKKSTLNASKSKAKAIINNKKPLSKKSASARPKTLRPSAKDPAKKPVASVPTKTEKPKPVVSASPPAPVKPVTAAAPAKPAPVTQKNQSKPAPAMDEKSKKMAANALKRIPPEKRTGVLAINADGKKDELTPSKIAHISYSITNPARKTDSYAIRPEKEPAGKFELEFVVHASAEMLYEFISTPSGLSEWFCDDLNIRNGIYTFIWDDQLQQARLLKTVDQQLVRFQWVDKTDGSYFEFRIQRDDLTNDISLIITDFAETNAERESSKLLWHSQVEKLMHVLGSIF